MYRFCCRKITVMSQCLTCPGIISMAEIKGVCKRIAVGKKPVLSLKATTCVVPVGAVILK